ncbi:MAG: hypothetical protein VB144_04055 [Clostridia bacterium]|nr:hypothetical protein [Clostridia bacterium]
MPEVEGLAGRLGELVRSPRKGGAAAPPSDYASVHTLVLVRASSRGQRGGILIFERKVGWRFSSVRIFRRFVLKNGKVRPDPGRAPSRRD